MIRFDYTYTRASGPIVVTVHAIGDRCVETFGDETPFIRHIHWTSADAVRCVTENHASIADPRRITCSAGLPLWVEAS